MRRNLMPLITQVVLDLSQSTSDSMNPRPVNVVEVCSRTLPSMDPLTSKQPQKRGGMSNRRRDPRATVRGDWNGFLRPNVNLSHNVRQRRNRGNAMAPRLALPEKVRDWILSLFTLTQKQRCSPVRCVLERSQRDHVVNMKDAQGLAAWDLKTTKSLRGLRLKHRLRDNEPQCTARAKPAVCSGVRHDGRYVAFDPANPRVI